MRDAETFAEDVLSAALLSTSLVLDRHPLLLRVMDAVTSVALALFLAQCLLAALRLPHPVGLGVLLAVQLVDNVLLTPLLHANLRHEDLVEPMIACMADAVAALSRVFVAALLFASAVAVIHSSVTDVRHAVALLLRLALAVLVPVL